MWSLDLRLINKDWWKILRSEIVVVLRVNKKFDVEEEKRGRRSKEEDEEEINSRREWYSEGKK